MMVRGSNVDSVFRDLLEEEDGMAHWVILHILMKSEELGAAGKGDMIKDYPGRL